MQVVKWKDGFAVAIPADVAAKLDLKEGDEVEVRRTSGTVEESQEQSPMSREEALELMKTIRWSLPAGYKFDREEANERR